MKRRRLARGRSITTRITTDVRAPLTDTLLTPTTLDDKIRPTEFGSRAFSDRKAALNLLQVARFDSAISPDQVSNLIATLTVSSLPC